MENDEDRHSAYDAEAMSSEPRDSEQDDSRMLITPHITPQMSEEERYFRLGQACEEFDAKVFMSIEGWLLEELTNWNRVNHPKLPKKVLRKAISWTFGEDDDDC